MIPSKIKRVLGIYRLTCQRCGRQFDAQVWYKWCEKCRNK